MRECQLSGSGLGEETQAGRRDIASGIVYVRRTNAKSSRVSGRAARCPYAAEHTTATGKGATERGSLKRAPSTVKTPCASGWAVSKGRPTRTGIIAGITNAETKTVGYGVGSVTFVQPTNVGSPAVTKRLRRRLTVSTIPRVAWSDAVGCGWSTGVMCRVSARNVSWLKILSPALLAMCPAALADCSTDIRLLPDYFAKCRISECEAKATDDKDFCMNHICGFRGCSNVRLTSGICAICTSVASWPARSHDPT